LGGIRDLPGNREIICLILEYEPISARPKFKVNVLWPDHQHLGTFAQWRYSEIV
jgi:hypothetical protein